MDAGIFIRSMAARGNLGGLARATVDAVAILDAAGYNKIIIETVGVGQDEVEVAGVADVTVLVLVPGMGDDVQAIKAGIMEIADIFVINKADQPGVARLEQELRAMLSLTGGQKPAIIHTVATDGTGVSELLDRHFPTHHLWRGELSFGEVVSVWLVFLLTQADHRLSRLQPWAEQNLLTLQALLGKTVRPLDFHDDRLADILAALAQAQPWQAFENDLNGQTVRVYDLNASRFRLDSTTANSAMLAYRPVISLCSARKHTASSPRSSAG